MRFARSPVAVALALAALGCDRDGASDSRPVASASAAPVSSASGRPPIPPKPLAGERIQIPGGSFEAGTLPGEAGRRPELEPRKAKVTLGPFTIDKLPFPNDPARPPKTEVTRDEADRLCQEAGARLCTELEWERACKGPRSLRYVAGETWNEACETAEGCASAFDVLAMGAPLREWTASDVAKTQWRKQRLAAIRGAKPGGTVTDHRCAARRGIDESEAADDLGFRCCKGPPNAALVDEPDLRQTFTKTRIKAKRLEKLLAETAVTRDIAKDVKFFREPEAANTVIARGDGDKKGFLFTVSPLLWNPVAGAEFLVLSGRSGDKTSFVLVFHVIAKDEYKLASSFIMKNEAGPVALAYNGYIRPRLHFSTCWGCLGQTGKVLYRKEEGVAIFQP